MINEEPRSKLRGIGYRTPHSSLRFRRKGNAARRTPQGAGNIPGQIETNFDLRASATLKYSALVLVPGPIPKRCLRLRDCRKVGQQRNIGTMCAKA